MVKSSSSQDLWSRLNTPLGSRSGQPFSRTQRRARGLMSVSAVLAVIAVGWWVLVAWFAWRATNYPVTTMEGDVARLALHQWNLLPTGRFHAIPLMIAWVLGFIATVLPLAGLWRLGRTLYTQPPLSNRVAQRFLGLAHALSINVVLGLVSSRLAATQILTYHTAVGTGFWGTLAAAVLAYVVADLVRTGALAADENQAFV